MPPMLALAHPDPALALPPETVLAPRIFLFNGTAHPVVASALVDWHSASQWGRTPLPPLTVAPGATQVLNLGERETKQLGIPPSADWASVQLSYASADSDLVAVAASLSADGKHLVQTPFSDALSWKWKGGEWMVDADHDALITAGNAGVNPARLDFKLRYGGGSQVYELPIRTLQPGEAITIDVAKIIMTQQPDRNGKVIPPSVMSGTYQFSDLDDIGMGYLYEGKQQIDKTYGHATYGCIPCCYYTDAWITDFAGKVGDSGPIPALAWESCPDGDDIVDVTSLTDTWASGNPNVATVSPDHVNAVGAGTTYSSGRSNLRTLHVHNDIYTCPGAYFYPQGQISVYPAVTAIQQSSALWFFGTGIQPPPQFTLGNTSATLTAAGGGDGTYVWTVTAGTSKLRLPGNTTTYTVTNSNTVTVNSISYSTQANDVTVQLQYTYPNTPTQTLTLSTSVDSPYNLVPLGTTDYAQTLTCQTPTYGSSGYLSLPSYRMQSFFGLQISNMYINETFGARSNDEPNTWATPTAGSYFTDTGVFNDYVCYIYGTVPVSLPPQSPLGTTKVFHLPQYWYVGTQSNGSGVEVQTDTIQYYTDHGRHEGIISPLR
jgi:hypothetical protein